MFFLAQNVLTVYLRNLETKNPQFKIYTAKQNKVSSSFELASVIYRSGVLYFASKTSIVSISYAEVNSSNLSGLEHSLWLSAHGHNQEKGWDTQGRERVFFFPPGAYEGLPSLHGEKRATARPLLLQWSGMCEGATYGKVVPSRPFHLRSEG